MYIMHTGLPVNCGPPQPPTYGIVNYTTTMVGSQATYQCRKGYIPSREFTTTCCEVGEWFPNPMGLTCIKEPCKQTDN